MTTATAPSIREKHRATPTGSKISLSMRGHTKWDLTGFLGLLDQGSAITVKLTDGTTVAGKYRDHTSGFARDGFLTLTQPGRKTGKRVRFGAVKSVTGIKGASLEELLTLLIAQPERFGFPRR